MYRPFTLAEMTDVRLRAIAVYLKDPAKPSEWRVAEAGARARDRMMRAGEAIYLDNFASCHTTSAPGFRHCSPGFLGFEGYIPVVQSNRPAKPIRKKTWCCEGAQIVAQTERRSDCAI